MLLEPKKAQLVVMTIACLHNFLRRKPDSAAIYTPPGTFDYEENGRVIEGSWRAMSNKNMTSLFPIRKIPCKPALKAKEIREELTAYFLSGGRVEWQNDCA
jgi:predicted RNase H-like nuclease